IRSIKTEPNPSGPGSVDVTYWTVYKYDEAGNRVRKAKWKYMGSDPEPVFEGDNPQWLSMSDEHYVRDVGGKEIAIYSGSTLTQWNFYGLDMLGHMNADTTKYYYLKDHLGSIRAVLNSSNNVASAQDYDAWGYLMESRTYESA